MAIKSFFPLLKASALLLCYIAVETECGFALWSSLPIHERPIIGILAQDMTAKLDAIVDDPSYTSYIPASAVKFIEGAGARVVPIQIGLSIDEYKEIMRHINGVFFPGGSDEFDSWSQYASAGKKIYDIAEEYNKGCIFFPIWGTSKGFDLLTYAAAGGEQVSSNCEGPITSQRLNFVKDSHISKMFAFAPSSVDLASYWTSIYPPTYCTTEKDLEKNLEHKNWKIISWNLDGKGNKYITAIEHKNRPYYGIQFDPEKNIYEWNSKSASNRDFKSIEASQYLANFFVNEASKNILSFVDLEHENDELINNYRRIFTGKYIGMQFDEVYVLSKKKRLRSDEL